MQNQRPQRTAAGFTLIEAMISMFFISFIVGEMAMVTTYSRRSTAYARRVTEANMLAEGVLEKSRNIAYNNINLRFSALNTPADPIRFDLDKNGTMESFSESCPPPTPPGGNPPHPTAPASPATQCGVDVGPYTVTRTVTPYLPSAAAAFGSSTAVDIDILVRWMDASKHATDDVQVEVSPGNVVFIHQVRVSTVRTKF